MTNTNETQTTDETTPEIERPTIGRKPEPWTHLGHVRYAAREEAGVRWYDPRDGREYMSFDVEATVDALDLGDEVLTVVTITPYQPAEFATPCERYMVDREYVRCIMRGEDSDIVDAYPGTMTVSKSDVVEGIDAARDLAAEVVPGYEDVPVRNAVVERVDEIGVDDWTEVDDR